MGFEEGFKVWSIDMVFVNGQIKVFTKASGKRTKCIEQALFIVLMAESIREREKTRK